MKMSQNFVMFNSLKIEKNSIQDSSTFSLASFLVCMLYLHNKKYNSNALYLKVWYYFTCKLK